MILHEVEGRFLQSSNTTTGSNSNDGPILKDTFVVYGSLLVFMFLLFCFVRRSFPRAYQLRNWVPEIKVCA
jgi:hypothetical protein